MYLLPTAAETAVDSTHKKSVVVAVAGQRVTVGAESVPVGGTVAESAAVGSHRKERRLSAVERGELVGGHSLKQQGFGKSSNSLPVPGSGLAGEQRHTLHTHTSSSKDLVVRGCMYVCTLLGARSGWSS